MAAHHVAVQQKQDQQEDQQAKEHEQVARREEGYAPPPPFDSPLVLSASAAGHTNLTARCSASLCGRSCSRILQNLQCGFTASLPVGNRQCGGKQAWQHSLQGSPDTARPLHVLVISFRAWVPGIKFHRRDMLSLQ